MGGQDWATGLVRAAAQLARQQGARGLVLAGGRPAGRVSMPSSGRRLGACRSDWTTQPSGVGDDEAVFWLGTAEDGAAYLAQLRKQQPTAVFVLGPAG